MSETTNKMRDVAIYSDSLIRVRDLAADAIEAVEAQVAEAVARVAALEKMGRLGASPNGDDRTRGGMSPRGFDSPTPAAPTPPAPSAVPAPRGFKKGDVVRTGGLSPFDAVVVEVREPQRENWNVTIKADRGTYKWHGPDLTLVRAAAAPEAPAEDAGLVERMAQVFCDTPCVGECTGGTCVPPGLPADGCDRANARAVLSALRAEGRLVEPGEVAALRVERDDMASQRDHWKARAEAAEKERDTLRAELDALRANGSICDPAEQARLRANNYALQEPEPELDALRLAARTWFNEKGEPELLATAEEVTERRKAAAKELAALRAKPRFRTRKVTAKDVGAWEEEWCKDSYGAGERHEAMNALGFRRRVDGAK